MVEDVTGHPRALPDGKLPILIFYEDRQAGEKNHALHRPAEGCNGLTAHAGVPPSHDAHLNRRVSRRESVARYRVGSGTAIRRSPRRAEIHEALLRDIGRATLFCVREGNGSDGTPLLGGMPFDQVPFEFPRNRERFGDLILPDEQAFAKLLKALSFLQLDMSRAWCEQDRPATRPPTLPIPSRRMPAGRR